MSRRSRHRPRHRGGSQGRGRYPLGEFPRRALSAPLAFFKGQGMDTFNNPAMAHLERLAQAQDALNALGTAAVWLIALGVALAVWNISKRRDP